MITLNELLARTGVHRSTFWLLRKQHPEELKPAVHLGHVQLWEDSAVEVLQRIRALSRRQSRFAKVSAFGREQSIEDWSREIGLPVRTLLYRFRHGWDVETALRTPFWGKRQRKPESTRA